MHGNPKYDANAAHLDYVNPKAPKAGHITMSTIGTFDTLNPYSIKGTAVQGLNLVYDRLMERVWDEPFTMYPLIAERIDIPEDRSSITVHINPKARFHDGSQITADDVIFSFKTLRESGRPNMRRIYKLVKTVEKRENLSVHFTFGDGYDQETVMIIALMPILSKTYWHNRIFDKTTLEIPLLNGPYEIEKFEPGRQITYKRKKDYWAKDTLTRIGHFNFQHITYDYYRDDTIALEAFKSGDIDIRREFDAGKWISAYDFPALSKGKVIKENIFHGRPERVRAMIFNTRRIPFDDIRVRKALNLIFDFEWINKNIFHGQYKQINSYFPNSELASQTQISVSQIKETASPRAKMHMANELLKESGWIVENGNRVKNGKIFKFEILINTLEDEKIALHFKHSLKKLGIKTLIRTQDSASFLDRLNEYDYDMTLHYWQNSLSPGTEQMLYWTCEAANQPAQWNYAGICDKEIDALSSKIAQAKTRKELIDTTQQLDSKLLNGHYIIPLYYSGADYISYWKPIHRPNKTPLYGIVLETWWTDQ